MSKYLLIWILLFCTCVCNVCGQSLMNDGFTDANIDLSDRNGRVYSPETGLAIPLPQENFDALLNAVSEYKNEGKLTEEEYDKFCTDLSECTPKDPFYRPHPAPKNMPGSFLFFETHDLNGKNLRSDELFGSHKVTLFNIWDTTCGACITEMPHLQQINEEFEERGGQVVGLVFNAVEEDLAEEARELSEDLALTYENLLPNEEIRSMFSIQSFPVTYFIDEHGKILGEPIFGTQIHKYRSRMTEILGNKE